MAYKEDLEAHIRESYKLIYQYTEILRLATNPIEKIRTQKTIEDQWELIKSYLDEYLLVCNRLHMSIADDLIEILARFPQIINAKDLSFQPIHTHELTRAIEFFISYAHQDERLRNELIKQLSSLKAEKLIFDWHDRQINPGKEWADEIDAHLNIAHVILLLVSPDFMASRYCYSVEMKRALERHEKKEAIVIPIILRPVDWQNAPFGKLQALPPDAKPVTTWRNRDKALLTIALGIKKVVDDLRGAS